MGNLWTGYSDSKLYKAELDCFLLCGVDPATITQENVILDGNPNSQTYIHTIRLKSTSDFEKVPTLVIIHGYGAGAASFCRMAVGLQKHFDLVIVDMLGLAGSGRPKYGAWDVDSAIAYQTDSLEAFFDR